MKNVKLWIFICAALFVAGIIGSIWVLNQSHGNYVEIVRDNTVLYRLDLSKTEDRTLEIDYNGKSNTVLIEAGQIRVSHADCPDQTCVEMGYLHSKSLPIVCLPNHLIIRYSGDTGEALDGTIR